MMLPRIWVARAVLALVPVLMTGCDSGGPAPGHPSTSAGVTTKEPSPPGRLLLQPQVSLDVPDIGLNSLSVWGQRYVAWTQRDGGRNPGVVHVYDLETHEQTTPLRTVYPRGVFGSLRGGGPAGQTLIVVELPDIPNDQAPDTTWQIVAADIRTGSRRVIRSSDGTTPAGNVPVPEVSGRWVVWAEVTISPPPVRAHVFSFDLITGMTRNLASTAPFPGPDVDGGFVYYREGSADASKAEAFRAPVDGTGAPVQLTHRSGQVGGLVVRNGAMAWNEPPLGRTHSVWASRPDGTAVTRIGDGDGAYPGAGFVVWATDGADRLEARSVRDGAVGPVATVQLAPYYGAGWSVDSSLLVWATFETGKHSTIRIATVTA